MPDTEPLDGRALYGPGLIRLFGCTVAGITVDEKKIGGRFELLADARLAWIYGFAIEGHYYDLPKPTIFIVNGDGQSAGDETLKPSLATTSLPAKPPEFYGDVKVWVVDRDDLGLRLDVESGPFQRILLDQELRGGAADTFHGRNVFLGRNVRVSGQGSLLGGADPRRSD